ncbi:glycosyltransferase family 39 protein [Flammeovirgaceae bacterium SG7u.111]|nr:glycosyltransferase family 39 protein [Flammeovirgaceae bacterium SG7u.132]WPO38486.1 glycosyltransferase family 39 protein [Flammeovirgaceae bacterium SG7u.111]
MNKLGSILYTYRYHFFFLIAAIIYLIYMVIDVIEIDSAQYAAQSMEMFMSKSYLHVFLRGKDYLDKPPMLFWLASSSFNLFGISNFTYKLPAVLVGILGIYSTYKFTELWYGKKKALIAGLIQATAQATMLVVNDVRTDGILTAFVIFGIWQLSAFLQKKKLHFLVGGAVGIACALMSKGPIALVIPIAAFSIDFILKREWKLFFKLEWLLFLLLVGVLLAPMLYGLYTQFDLHPEKEVYGLKGPSGIKFFFWTQSFGRITGDNYWSDNTTFFYFFHTILWDFQPWVIFFIIAFISKTINIFKQGFRISQKQEYISYAGFLFPFLAMSTSSFKLPHYIFPLLPLAAIITADFLGDLWDKKSIWLKRLARIQFGIMHLFFLLAAINFILFFPPESVMLPAVIALFFVLFWIAFLKINDWLEKLVVITAIAILGFNLLMSVNFYPNLMKYQGSSLAGRFIREGQKEDVYWYKAVGTSLDFYARKVVPKIEDEEIEQLAKGAWVYTTDEGLKGLKPLGVEFDTVKTFPGYPVSQLSIHFLKQNTRQEQLHTYYLLEKK